MGAAFGGLGGAAFGTNGVNGFLGEAGRNVGLGLLVAGAGYSVATGGFEGLANFGASVAGGIVGAGIGAGINKGLSNLKANGTQGQKLDGSNKSIGSQKNTPKESLNADQGVRAGTNQGLANRKIEINVDIDDIRTVGRSVVDDSALNSSINNLQERNYNRFIDRLPSQTEQPRIINFGNGSVAFQAKVPANNISGSFAVYEKQVDVYGNTIQYTKTTYAPNGGIVHIKDKITGQTLP
jgi:hypothetical protein